MTSAQLRAEIESVLGSVEYKPPMSFEFCAAVRDALRVRVPGAEIEAYYRPVLERDGALMVNTGRTELAVSLRVVDESGTAMQNYLVTIG